MFPHRFALLEQLPRGGVCAEIGIEHCLFSRAILETTRPACLHLVESNPVYVVEAERLFAAEIADGRVITHSGDSRVVGKGFPDDFFDWVYIDGDHRFKYVSVDLEHARRTVKDDGLIVVNDYIMHDHISDLRYGVVEAVNTFCLDHGYEIVFLALHPQMFCDVALRRIQD